MTGVAMFPILLPSMGFLFRFKLRTPKDAPVVCDAATAADVAAIIAGRSG